jgi:hypothetical protein
MTARCKCGARVSEPARCLNGHVQPEAPPVQLEGIAELIAQSIKATLADEFRVAAAAKAARPDPEELVDVHEMARAAGMSPSWVYDHALELGGVKAGGTKRARWRFDRERALARLAEREEGAEARGPQDPAPPPGRELLTDVDLLPVKGRAG